MTKTELVIKIGTIICEDCNPTPRCGKVPKECAIVKNALDILNKFLEGEPTGEKIPYVTIINYLNSKARTNFKATAQATQRHIKARWKEGYKLEDFFKVIDTMCKKWMSDAKMVDYLRPQTLFGTKFESYLQMGRTVQQPRIYEPKPEPRPEPISLEEMRRIRKEKMG